MGTFAGSVTVIYPPELKVGDSGSEFCRVRLRSQERRFDNHSNKWVKEDPFYFTMTVYKGLARNLERSVTDGDRLLVIGKLVMERYQDGQGVEREDMRLIPHHVGVDLRYHSAPIDDGSELDSAKEDEMPL